MFFCNSISALVVVLLASLPIHAHSTRIHPLKRIANPSTLSLDIIPRQPHNPSITAHLKRTSQSHSITLHHDDSFRLVLSAFDDTFHLHLRPNDHLIHSAARINYYSIGPDGRSVLSHTEPLLRESVKAYWGEVIASHHSPTRLREDAARLFPMPHPADRGWARIMVHHQGDSHRGLAPVFEGAFSADGVIHHVVTKENYLRNKQQLDPDLVQPIDELDGDLVIWRESDLMSPHENHVATTGMAAPAWIPEPQSCGHDRLDYNVDPAQNPILQAKVPNTSSWFDNPFGAWSNGTLLGRDDTAGGNGMGTNFINTIGQAAGCPLSQKVVYMGVAADCTYVSRYGSQGNATTQILTNWNTASALYKSTFNVSLGILELQVQSSVCPSTADPNIPWNIPCSGAELDNRLSIFSQWRGAKGDDGIGLWHLMSGCPTGNEVGIAWLATLCQQSASGNAPTVVSGTAVSTFGSTEWQVVAHEIGHNFGAIHDCTDGCTTTSACCPLTPSDCNAGSRFIMSPVAQSNEKVFSPCSLGNICSVMQNTQSGSHLDTSCVVDPDPTKQTKSLQMCGNGIVEQGEDCDPGNGATSSCCDVTTCKFKTGAVCDPSNSACCTDTCVFAPSSKVCRPARDGTCDFAETCTGNSSSCPTDKFANNGKSCGSGDLKCAGGICTSNSQQCQSVGGSMGYKDACSNPGDTCQVSCNDPTRSNTCVLLNALLVDGSPCGFGGTCLSGKCQSAGFLDTAKAWYTKNLQIAIPVTVVAGLVVILLLWVIYKGIRRCCIRRRAVPVAPMFVSQGPPLRHRSHHERLSSYDNGLGNRRSMVREVPPTPGSGALYTRVPPASHERSFSNGAWDTGYYSTNNHGNTRGNWVDDAYYNGPAR